MLGDLLAARPAERAILLSSREPLPLDVGRYLAPHQVLTLGPAELQLDGEEAASVFEGSDLAQPIVDRFLRLAAGWPTALLLLARIAHYEPELERLLDRLDASIADPHEYLLSEVLSALTPEMTTTLLAAAAIGEATLEDISAATDISHAAPIVEGLLRLPGFISYESGAYRMHPLLHTALSARFGADLSETLCEPPAATHCSAIFSERLSSTTSPAIAPPRPPRSIVCRQLRCTNPRRD